MAEEHDPSQGPPADEAADAAELAGGNYEVIRRRLVEGSRELRRRTDALNEDRKQVFGGSELAVVANERVRTENNCVPRDIVHVGGHLWFGYNVFIGLKKETAISDVFALHRFEPDADDDGYDCSALDLAEAAPWLLDDKFAKDFQSLYSYYRDAKLLQLVTTDTRLLAVFQIGATHEQTKIYRWRVQGDGRIAYIDDRGEDDYVFPPPHDFEWTVVGREHQVGGEHPHVNIDDTLFVDTLGGDLTVKIEDNTATGEGIYAEPVEDGNQILDDAQFHYARLGGLIVLKILPFREARWRYLVYSDRTHEVTRIDAIGQACVQLPEDHGVLFPGGYYLQSGEYKVFEGDVSDLQFKRAIKSPNGEDVLYVFHRRRDGHYALFPYNLIRKEVQSPIHCHGYSLFDDGRLVVFRSISGEPTRIHPMQVWQTPFTSVEYAASAPTDGSFLAKVGNADLVRGISEAYSVIRLANADEPSRVTYEDLIATASRAVDSYYWLGAGEVGDLKTVIAELRRTAELIIDEFEKVQAFRQQAAAALAQTQADVAALDKDLHSERWHEVSLFLGALTRLRSVRGHIITLRDMRYMDLERTEALEREVIDAFDRVSRDCVRFLLRDEAFTPLAAKLDGALARSAEVKKVADLEPLKRTVEETGEGLDLLGEVIGNLQIDDATQRTQILESISDIFAHTNRVRATIESRYRELMSHEGRAEFGAQFKLLGQSVASALALADTPERCDEELARVMVQLEELEGRFSEFDEFLADLAGKREEIYEAFSGKKQTLLDERQRRTQNIIKASERILDGVGRRARSLASTDEVNSYFASDAMVLKLYGLAEDLTALGETVKADEITARLKAAKQDAVRALRDRLDLYEDGANIIKLGRHRFTVNNQPLDLTMVERDGEMMLHLGGTDFYEAVTDPEFAATRGFWSQDLVSETRAVYRGEYLAARMLLDAERGDNGLSIPALRDDTRSEGGLAERVKEYAQERYDEGYERGLHDADAARILERILAMRDTAGLLRFSSIPRALAVLFWAEISAQNERRESTESWHRQAQSLGRLRTAFDGTRGPGGSLDGTRGPGGSLDGTRGPGGWLDGATGPGAEPGPGGREASTNRAGSAGPSGTADRALADELGRAIAEFAQTTGVAPVLGLQPGDRFAALCRMAGDYLAHELADSQPHFISSQAGQTLAEAVIQDMELHGARMAFDDDTRALRPQVAPRLALACAWVEAFCRSRPERAAPAARIVEAATLLATAEHGVLRQVSSALTEVEVKGLLGRHPRIDNRTMHLALDEFETRRRDYVLRQVPAYRAYRQLRHQLLVRERRRLRLGELMPKVMTSFVRNKLIGEVYLHLIGDNLAKQMGAAGADKRTDLMGMLLLISPPGYGKTTLMEYIANRLGLVFVKVNGPSLGHSVHSLDPVEAPNATARQEVDKINLALEMGNNVMLYLDDIQHTHPELLQKFISLCDAQRRIDGVWKGNTRTYDMRGKKFCVVMAGNPYTESGESFQIPDMLANRADVYNLGDVLSGKEDSFALSYIENALTSNPTLAPLATREQSDVYKLIRMADGEDIPTSELSHGYSAVELSDVLAVLRHLFRAQRVLLAVNQLYIESAAQDDRYRTEPPFKLQGSYRNMNKLAEKIVSAMTEEEVERLIDDHYLGEAQTLTTEAEHNLLKLAELRGRQDAETERRWAAIKTEYARLKRMGAADDDPVTRVTGTLSSLADKLDAIGRSLDQSVEQGARAGDLAKNLAGIQRAVEAGSHGDLTTRLDTLGTALGGIRDALASAADAAATSAQRHDPGHILASIETHFAGLQDALTTAIDHAASDAKLIGMLGNELSGIRDAILHAVSLFERAQRGAQSQPGAAQLPDPPRPPE